MSKDDRSPSLMTLARHAPLQACPRPVASPAAGLDQPAPEAGGGQVRRLPVSWRLPVPRMGRPRRCRRPGSPALAQDPAGCGLLAGAAAPGVGSARPAGAALLPPRRDAAPTRAHARSQHPSPAVDLAVLQEPLQSPA